MCKQDVNKEDVVRISNYNYHPHCAEQKKEKDELTDFICKLFGFKAPGPRIYAQIKKFVNDNGYTYKEIRLTLDYFFNVKKNDINKANQGIGIVPYVYDDAKEYYQKMAFKQHKIAEKIQKDMGKEKKTIVVKKTGEVKPRITLVDMDSLLEEE